MVKTLIKIPVIANGDITTPEKAKHVLDVTGADGIMIGRAAQGRPWLFREIEHYLKTGEHLPPAEVSEIHSILLAHLEDLYAFYGPETGFKVARKHISWYTKGLIGSAAFRKEMNVLPSIEQQMQAVNDFFLRLAAEHQHLKYISEEVLAA
jgi:tRNA-dihydrouridine synthase B